MPHVTFEPSPGEAFAQPLRSRATGTTSSRCKRLTLLLGALVFFLLFAPRGFVYCLAALSVVAGLLDRVWRLQGDAWSKLEAAEPVSNADEDSAEHEDVSGGYGDWGPALVLVFEARDPVTEEQRLRVADSSADADEKDEGDDEFSPFSSWTLEAVGEHESTDKDDDRSPAQILARLRGAGLEYRLAPSRSGEYIFCVVRLPELTALGNLSFYPVDLQLDPSRARKCAAEFGMPLASRLRGVSGVVAASRSVSRAASLSKDAGPHATLGYCNNSNGSNALSREIESQSLYGSLADEAQRATAAGLSRSVWHNLYMRFVPTMPSELFRHYELVSDKPWSAAVGCGGIERRRRPTMTGTLTRADSFSATAASGSPPFWGFSAELFENDVDSEDAEQGGNGGVVGRPPSAELETLLPPSARLRLLLNLVSDDLPGAFGVRGPGLKLDAWKKPKLCNCLQRTFRNLQVGQTQKGQRLLHSLEVPNPFLCYFLMQDPRDVAYRHFAERFGKPASRLFRRGLFMGVFDAVLPGRLYHYFGHQIAFYFAFKQHLFGYGLLLSILLAPLLAIYSFDWARSRLGKDGQQRLPVSWSPGSPGQVDEQHDGLRWPLWSLLAGMTVIIWGQCAIESWRREEHRLGKAWGSHRVTRRPTARPHFRGRMVLSKVDGRLTMQHISRRAYWARVLTIHAIFILLTLLFGMLVKIAWGYKLDRHSGGEEGSYAILGVVFTLLTIVLMQILKAVAWILTDVENHKHEEHWEASLLVKRWMLTVVLQCWAVFYLLFVKPVLTPCAYGSDAVRREFGVSDCADDDFACCDVQLLDGNNVLLSFAQVRDEAVILHTRRFVAGWLISRIFLHNFMRWFMPQVCGFLCIRGLYPTVAVDFFQDLFRGFTSGSSSSQSSGSQPKTVRRSRRFRWCCRRHRKRAQTEFLYSGPSGLPETVLDHCELLLDRQDPWDVLESANFLSVHFLVTSVTMVVYPFAPLLFTAHLFFEFQMDLWGIFARRPPKPRVAAGLPKAWLVIFQSYVYVGALSNLAVVTWRTPLLTRLLGAEVGQGTRLAFVSTSMLGLVWLHLVAGWWQVSCRFSCRPYLETCCSTCRGKRKWRRSSWAWQGRWLP
eukprot:TRINITY_DN5571_c0_g2_i2.p1 TRINITY_DN5571_c0_g2~~TRINITY_DN5571_c0_g2_i2.p1  ORF type:complete len:1110 (-),score=246.35 TRINITY_DN5571_c0_g2_i2:410-3739(-)